MSQLINRITPAAAALAVVFALSGCKTAPAPAADDASLNTALQNRLQSDSGLAGQPFQATVQGSVATLSGSVTNPAARSLAANDAAEVAGLRAVVNNLSITGSTPTAPAVAVAPPPAPVKTVPVREPKVKVSAQAPQRAYNPAPEPAPIERQQPYISRNDSPPPPATRQSGPAFRNIRIPSGTDLPVRITQTLDSATTQPGTTFSGVLASDVVIDGIVALPSGSRVSGRVEDAKDAGHFSGNSLLSVSLTSISRRGDNFPITTDTYSKQGNGRGKNTAEKIGGGAAVGAILGGIFGGGKGAAIGAGAGGGLGAGANGVTRGQQVQIPSESLVRFRLTSEVNVRASVRPEGDNNQDFQRHNQ